MMVTLQSFGFCEEYFLRMLRIILVTCFVAQGGPWAAIAEGSSPKYAEISVAQISQNKGGETSSLRALMHFTRGLGHHRKGDLDRALVEYGEAIKLDPEYATAYLNRGISHSKKREFDKAIVDYDQAIKLNPNDTMAYHYRGIAYTKKGEPDRAVADYDKAIELNPNDAKAYHNRGIAYARKGGEVERAIADFDKAIALDPKLTGPYYNRGIVYYGRGELDRAISDFDKAIALSPKLAAAYVNRGSAYADKGQYDKAIADYDRAIALDPNLAVAHARREDALAKSGRDVADKDEAQQDQAEIQDSTVARNGRDERAVADDDKAAQDQAAITVELNKLEPYEKGCRVYILISNTSSTTYDAFKLDLVMFKTDGIIGRRFEFNLAPMPALKRTVKLFDLNDPKCEDIGSFLVNDVMECRSAGRAHQDCFARLKVSSRSKVKISK